jgi:hypothetical protein
MGTINRSSFHDAVPSSLVAASGGLPDSLRTFQDNKSFSFQIVGVTGSRQQLGKPLIHVDGPGRTAPRNLSNVARSPTR